MQSIQSGRFRYIGHGQYIANYIYAEDVAAACIHVTRFKQAEGKTYIVSDSCPLREFVETAASFIEAPSPTTVPLWIAQLIASGSTVLEKITDLSLPLTQSRVQALTNLTEYSSAKLRQNLGFHPAVGYKEGLNRTIRWYKEQSIVAN